MWIDELRTYVAQAGVEGVDDTDVFTEALPGNVKQGVMVAGPQIGVHVDPELPGYHRTTFQVIVRAVKSKVAEELAMAISDAIETEEGTTLDEIQLNFVRPRHLPVSYPRSDGDFHEASVNFDLCFIRL